jgi:UDP-N-acetylglucosamine acyltransferase
MTDQPQNAAWTGELAHAGVRICRGAVIREAAVIHQGSYRATTVGAESWILNRAYLAHDVLVGEHTTISAGVSVGGHCVIGDRVNIGMNASVHQRVFVATGCMIGMGTPLARDLPPFVKAFGSPARIHGLNSVGMQRFGISAEEIEELAGAYDRGDLLLDTHPGGWGDKLGPAVSQWLAREDRRPATMR